MMLETEGVTVELGGATDIVRRFGPGRRRAG